MKNCDERFFWHFGWKGWKRAFPTTLHLFVCKEDTRNILNSMVDFIPEVNAVSQYLKVATCAVIAISTKSRITGAVVPADGIYAGGIILTIIRS